MDKKQIEAEIEAKKEAIKQANRELSKLQDELKKKDEPLKIACSQIFWDSFTPHMLTVKVLANKNLEDFNRDRIKRAIDSLSDPVKPKSYVDWDKIPNDFDWVAMDKDGKLGRYRNKPTIREHMNQWSDGNGIYNVLEEAILSFPKDWRDSLIHRPGVKE